MKDRRCASPALDGSRSVTQKKQYGYYPSVHVP
jgi:hypothetical protein